MTHVTYRLTAKNRDQLQNSMLGNRVWATFTFFTYFKLKLTILFNLAAEKPHFLFGEPWKGAGKGMLLLLWDCRVAASRTNIYSSNSEDESSEEEERNRKRLLKAKKLDSDKVRPWCR